MKIQDMRDGTGDQEMGIGDWGLVEPVPVLDPVPIYQSPIPNHHARFAFSSSRSRITFFGVFRIPMRNLSIMSFRYWYSFAEKTV